VVDLVLDYAAEVRQRRDSVRNLGANQCLPIKLFVLRTPEILPVHDRVQSKVGPLTYLSEPASISGFIVRFNFEPFNPVVLMFRTTIPTAIIYLLWLVTTKIESAFSKRTHFI
jgi:hypothetical protein